MRISRRLVRLWTVAPLIVVSACSIGGHSDGLGDFEPVDLQVRAVLHGDVMPDNTESEAPEEPSGEVSEESVHKKVGESLAQRAEELTSPVADSAEKPDYQPFARLSPQEVAVLSAEAQVFVPAVGCAQINGYAKDDIAEDANLAACDDKGSKFLLAPATLDNSDVASAHATTMRQSGENVVGITFTKAATPDWEKLAADNVDKRVAFAIDGGVVSAPTITAPLTGSSVDITGDFTKEEAEKLAARINAGAEG